MIPTFLDLRTGKTARGSDMSVFWWTEGNGACDCNRVIAFPYTIPGRTDACMGCKRFIAIDVEGDLEDALSKEHVLVAMNSEYGK